MAAALVAGPLAASPATGVYDRLVNAIFLASFAEYAGQRLEDAAVLKHVGDAVFRAAKVRCCRRCKESIIYSQAVSGRIRVTAVCPPIVPLPCMIRCNALRCPSCTLQDENPFLDRRRY